MGLREYQSKLLKDTREALKTNKRICVVLGCGGGKTVIQAETAKLATAKGNRVLYLVHRKELVAQTIRTFEKWGVDMSLCDVLMVQTATRRTDNLQKPNLIITDEAHHALAKTYKRIYDTFPDAYHVGFTATPIRLGKGGLGGAFDELVEGVSTGWLINHSYLAPYEYYSYQFANTDNLHKSRGEFVESEIAELMEDDVIYGKTVKVWLNHARDKQTIVYCASVKASKATAEEYQQAGIYAYHLDGNTSQVERDQAISDFREGKIKVLCNVDLFGEGFDVPDCECVQLLRPTASLSLHIQQSMRSMRYKEGKTAIILDHVQNYKRHGLPDTVHEWTLEEQASKKQNELHIKECPDCFSVLPSNVSVCPECQHVFEKQERQERMQVEAELTKVNALTGVLNKKTLAECKTFDDLIEVQKANGYKFSWCIFKAKYMGIKIPEKYRYRAQLMGVL